MDDEHFKWVQCGKPSNNQAYLAKHTIQDMFKRNYSNIEAMKELTIKHEGWVRSYLLPEGWMFKQIAEGITKDNECMKTSLDHMESLTEYSEVEVTDCQEFLREQKNNLA